MTYTETNYPTHHTPDTYEQWRASRIRRIEFRRWLLHPTTPAAHLTRARIVAEIGGHAHPDWTPERFIESVGYQPTSGPMIRHLVAVMGDTFDATDFGHRAFHRAMDRPDQLSPLCVRCWL